MKNFEQQDKERVYEHFDNGEKALALTQLLDLTLDETLDIEENFDEYEHDGHVYLILPDDEADERFDEYIDNLIDDVIKCEVPEQFQCYMDFKAMTDDYRAQTGRGEALATYDAIEHDELVDGVRYFIYRIS